MLNMTKINAIGQIFNAENGQIFINSSGHTERKHNQMGHVGMFA